MLKSGNYTRWSSGLLIKGMTTIQNLARHPYQFYQKCGFAIVGVTPDANGVGKADIIMAKRLN